MQQSPLGKGELAFGVWSTEDRRYGQITELGHQESNSKLCNGIWNQEEIWVSYKQKPGSPLRGGADRTRYQHTNTVNNCQHKINHRRRAACWSEEKKTWLFFFSHHKELHSMEENGASFVKLILLAAQQEPSRSAGFLPSRVCMLCAHVTVHGMLPFCTL